MLSMMLCSTGSRSLSRTDLPVYLSGVVVTPLHAAHLYEIDDATSSLGLLGHVARCSGEKNLWATVYLSRKHLPSRTFGRLFFFSTSRPSAFRNVDPNLHFRRNQSVTRCEAGRTTLTQYRSRMKKCFFQTSTLPQPHIGCGCLL